MNAIEHERLHERETADAVASVLDALHDAGERITAARRLVVEALARHPQHLSADELEDLLRSSRAGVHRATVYRSLELLAALGLVACVQEPGGASSYHLARTGAPSAHVHVRCRLCGRVMGVPAELFDTAVRAAETRTGFRLEPESSTLSGICQRCRR